MYQCWYKKAMRLSGYQIRKCANFPRAELAWTLKRCGLNPPMGGFTPDTDLQICTTAPTTKPPTPPVSTDEIGGKGWMAGLNAAVLPVAHLG